MQFKSLLEAAAKRRAQLASRTEAYRVVNGAADGLPGFTLDKFKNHFQAQFFSEEFLRHEAALVEAVLAEFTPEFFAVKYRLSPSGAALEHPEVKTVCGSSSKTVVSELGVKFAVDLLDTVNPGLFLDMRDIRGEVAALAAGRELLNLFSYTCSFGVHARAAGALKAVNVDISGKALEKGRANYALNALTCLPGEFFKGNAFEYLEWAGKRGKKFGVVVLDPPSFARHKGFSFNVREDFGTLVRLSAGVLEAGGFLMASSNYAGFELRSFVANTLAEVQKERPWARLVWAKSQGIDFPSSGSRESSLCAVLIAA